MDDEVANEIIVQKTVTLPAETAKESVEEVKQEKVLACDSAIQKRVGIIEELKLTFKRFDEEENRELERGASSK